MVNHSHTAKRWMKNMPEPASGMPNPEKRRIKSSLRLAEIKEVQPKLRKRVRSS